MIYCGYTPWDTYAVSQIMIAPLLFQWYICAILMTLTVSPVSYVAPMQVISTLIGILPGTHFLQEGYGFRQFVAAVVMVPGVIFLNVG